VLAILALPDRKLWCGAHFRYAPVHRTSKLVGVLRFDTVVRSASYHSTDATLRVPK
jgi:hypothetical protein